jgi:hypothetical protein
MKTVIQSNVARTAKPNITVELTQREYDYLVERMVDDQDYVWQAIQAGDTPADVGVQASDFKLVMGLFPKFGLSHLIVRDDDTD